MPKLWTKKGNTALIAVSREAGDVGNIGVLCSRQARFRFDDSLFVRRESPGCVRGRCGYILREKESASMQRRVSSSSCEFGSQWQAQQVVERDGQIVDAAAFE